MKRIRKLQLKIGQLRFRLSATGCLIIFGGFSLSSQDLFETPSYELFAEEIRNQAKVWNLKPDKVKAVLELDIESYYGRSSSPERKQQQMEQLQELREKYLDQFFYIDQRPSAHIYDDSEQYNHEEHGVTIYHHGLNFMTIPKKTIEVLSGILTSQIQSLENLTPKFEAFEKNRDNHQIMLLFKLNQESARFNPRNKELLIKDARVLIYNKYSEEIVYDHLYTSALSN